MGNLTSYFMMKTNRYGTLVLLFLINLLLSENASLGQNKRLVFPVPQSMQLKDGRFSIDSSAYILLSKPENKRDEFLAKLFQNELVDQYAEAVKISAKPIPVGKNKFIVIGTIANPSVRNFCERDGLLVELKNLGKEGYIISVSAENVVVAANNNEGALMGLQSLRQLVYKEKGKLFIPQLVIKDAPVYPFRGIKLYLPGKENIAFFKRFIKDFVVLYKYNKIILELNANMRLDKHPELNVGAVKFARHLKNSRLDRPPGVHNEYQNSSHQDNADGQILEKEEVADLVSYMRKFGIEVIPELPSLTHAYYLLAGHEELAENMNQEYPDTYCPLKPGSHKLYFDVLDEYIEVIRPAMIHVGHDEWRMEKDLCELCKGKDYGKLFADDLVKIHGYLAGKGIKTAIWGDHLLESVTEKDHQTWKSSTGYTYKIPGSLKPEQVIKLIPKNILIFNWFWNDINNDKQVSDFGFQQVYGNLRADIDDWSERKDVKKILGGAPSSWAGTTEMNFGKDQLFDFLGSANLLWSKHYLPVDKLAFTIEPLIAGIYKNMSGNIIPGDDKSIVTPINLSSFYNASLNKKIDGFNNSSLLSGEIKKGNMQFAVAGYGNKNIVMVDNSEAKSVNTFPVNKDINSILFLHACANEALNTKAYGMIYNFDDSAEPLGWYEVVYEDGMVEVIPLRYGVNIMDVAWRKRIMNNERKKEKYSQNKYAYQASAVECSIDSANSLTFFSFEWENKRFGRKIKEVRLKQVDAGTGNKNAIMLLAMSVSESKKITNAKGVESQ
jgi:hypothetical protein